MKLVLQEIVCENQSAFVAERLITDNVLVAHEVMTHIGKQRRGKRRGVSIEVGHEQSL